MKKDFRKKRRLREGGQEEEPMLLSFREVRLTENATYGRGMNRVREIANRRNNIWNWVEVKGQKD